MTAVQSQVGRRGRPRRSEEAAITERIVLSARQLFLTEGYGATSMVRIGEAAQVSPGTLYARFADKAALFRAVVQRQAELWRQNPPAADALPARTLREVLEGDALRLLGFLSTPEIDAFNRLVNAEAVRFPELARIYSDDALRLGLERIARRILATPEGARLGREDADALALTLLEAVLGWSQMRVYRDDRDPSAAEQSAAQRIATFLARIAPR